MVFLNYLINGISLGSIYAIIALGYTMVYGIAKMLNFAHGDVIMVGAYICFFSMNGLSSLFAPGSLAALVVPALAGTVLAMVVCTVLGITIERLAYKPLRQATSLAVLITAIGVSYFLQNAAQLLWSSSPKVFTPVVSQSAKVTLFDGQLSISWLTIVTVLVSPWAFSLPGPSCWPSPPLPAAPRWARPCGPARRTRRRPSSWASTSTAPSP